MLQYLSIRNYVLIRSIEIDFHQGFNVITGETGAGKSILLGALGLVLGNRAESDLCFEPGQKCVVEAHFLTEGFDFSEFFRKSDIDAFPDHTLIIRREILPGGKSRAFINDTPVTLTQLKELSANLVDIHSQHETLTLHSADFQRRLIDSYSFEPVLLQEYAGLYRRYEELRCRCQELKEEQQRGQDEQEYHRFLFQELSQMNLKEGEQQAMEQALERLSQAELIKSTLSQTVAEIDGEEYSMKSRLEALIRGLRKIAGCHPGVASQLERWDALSVELNDLGADLQRWAEEEDMDPRTKEEYESRLDRIYRLENKHRVGDVSDLIAIRDELGRKLDRMENGQADLQALETELEQLRDSLSQKAESLSLQRKQTAKVLESAILASLSDLGMEKSVLRIDIQPMENFTPYGKDRVVFLFSANQGNPPVEIARAASGGELSRLMLAVKSVIHRNSLIGTLVLDEIDTGVSGKIAGKVAAMMRRMSRYMQVVAITHLPQIAAAADAHFWVFKKVEDGHTLSHIEVLDRVGHIESIAAMLSNEQITEAAVKAAEELVRAGGPES